MASASEAQYALDDEMKRTLRSLASATDSGRPARETELSQRLLARAQATWPPSSLALAHVRLLALTALDKARRATGFPFAAPSAEERALLSAVDDVLAARTESRTLLRATPSEAGFLKEFAHTYTSLLGPGDKPPQGDELGYVVALLAGSVHLTGLLEAIMHGDSRPGKADAVAAHGAAVLRVFALIVAERCDAASPILELGGVVQEVDLQQRMGEFFVPMMRANDKAGLPLARHVPSQLLSQLLAAWHRVEAVLGAEHKAVSAREVRASDAATAARRQEEQERWERRACAHCGAPEAEPRQWKVCGRCGGAAYCCREHQAAHWKAGHKRECRERPSYAV